MRRLLLAGFLAGVSTPALAQDCTRVEFSDIERMVNRSPAALHFDASFVAIQDLREYVTVKDMYSKCIARVKTDYQPGMLEYTVFPRSDRIQYKLTFAPALATSILGCRGNREYFSSLPDCSRWDGGR